MEIEFELGSKEHSDDASNYSNCSSKSSRYNSKENAMLQIVAQSSYVMFQLMCNQMFPFFAN